MDIAAWLGRRSPFVYPQSLPDFGAAPSCAFVRRWEEGGRSGAEVGSSRHRAVGEGCPRAGDGSSRGPSVAAEQHPPWMTSLVSIPRVVFRAGSPPCVLLRMLSLCSWCAHRSIWRRRTLHFVLEQHPSLSEPLSPGTRHKPNLVTETESVQQLLGVF